MSFLPIEKGWVIFVLVKFLDPPHAGFRILLALVRAQHLALWVRNINYPIRWSYVLDSQVSLPCIRGSDRFPCGCYHESAEGRAQEPAALARH